MVSTVKDPTFVEAGRRGAEKRWADPASRTVRLDALTREQRAVVLALVTAARAAQKADGDA